MFRCLASLEDRVYKVYKLISSRVEDPQVTLTLLFIGYDSLKHSEVFKSMTRILESQESIATGECEEELGLSYARLMSLLDEVERQVKYRRSLPYEEIVEALRRLIQVEECISEECLVQVMTRIMSEEAKEELVEFREMLRLISKDEERHNTLLREALELLERRRRSAEKSWLKLE